MESQTKFTDDNRIIKRENNETLDEMIDRVLKWPSFINLTEYQKDWARLLIAVHCDWSEFEDNEL